MVCGSPWGHTRYCGVPDALVGTLHRTGLERAFRSRALELLSRSGLATDA